MAKYKQFANYELVILTGISFLCNNKKFASGNGLLRLIAVYDDILQYLSNYFEITGRLKS